VGITRRANQHGDGGLLPDEPKAAPTNRHRIEVLLVPNGQKRPLIADVLENLGHCIVCNRKWHGINLRFLRSVSESIGFFPEEAVLPFRVVSTVCAERSQCC